MWPKKWKKAVPEGLEEDAGRKHLRENHTKGPLDFWVRLQVAIWSHVGLQKRGQESQKSEKKRDYCRLLEGLPNEYGFGDDFGTIFGAR